VTGKARDPFCWTPSTPTINLIGSFFRQRQDFGGNQTEYTLNVARRTVTTLPPAPT